MRHSRAPERLIFAIVRTLLDEHVKNSNEIVQVHIRVQNHTFFHEKVLVVVAKALSVTEGRNLLVYFHNKLLFILKLTRGRLFKKIKMEGHFDPRGSATVALRLNGPL